MTQVETKNSLLNQLSHSGAPRSQPVSAEPVALVEAFFLLRMSFSACLKAIYMTLEMAQRLQKAVERKPEWG